MYKKILVALNDNERAFKALAYAVTMSEKMSAELYLVFVLQQNQAAAQTNKHLGEKIEDQFPGLSKRIQLIKKEGRNVAALIIETAEEAECDLIVLGSRRLPGASSVIRRSVANAVISSCHKPVLIV